MEVVKLTGQEPDSLYRQIAQIHREEISEGFLSTLGDDFLTTLYKTLATSPVAFLLIAQSAGEATEVQGFIAGSLATGQVYKDFARRAGPKAFLALAPKILSPARIKRIVETLLYPNKQKQTDLPDPEILNFCVRSTLQGKGVGGKLFTAFIQEMKERGINKVRIVTGESQVSAQQFYEAKGAVLAQSIEVHKGTASRVYVYTIHNE